MGRLGRIDSILSARERHIEADKVSGDLAGAWLLVAEHLRLGTWDLLCGWTRQPAERVEPRLALQLVHEAAVCTTGIRAERTLHRRGGFELLNGLPFVATDIAIHEMLGQRSVADCERLQMALGKLRAASGHFQGKLLAVDPHRMVSHSRRHMRKRAEKGEKRPVKKSQTFWMLDAETHQPVCFTTGTPRETLPLRPRGCWTWPARSFRRSREAPWSLPIRNTSLSTC